MYHPPTGPPRLKWSSLLLREGSRGTRWAISQRLDSIENLIRGHVLSPDEIVQKCDSADYGSVKAHIQTILLLLIHASIKTGKMGWLEDKSLHYHLQLLDVDLPSFPVEHALQLQQEIYSSTIEILKNIVASERAWNSTFWRQPLEPLIHNDPTTAMSDLGGLCKSSGSAMMRRLFHIATAYTVPSDRNHYALPYPCADTECSHIDCQLVHTWPDQRSF